MYISTREMVISIICNACGVIGLILWAIEAHKSNAIQRIQSVKSVKSVEDNGDIIVRSSLYPFRVVEADHKDEPQTCSVNGRPYSECSSCEHFRCTADEPQTEISTNNSTISEKLQLKDEQSGKE